MDLIFVHILLTHLVAAAGLLQLLDVDRVYAGKGAF